jgi:hypothetical protein
VRLARRCMADHNRLMAAAVRRLRAHPPAQHTIAGAPVCALTCMCKACIGVADAACRDWSVSQPLPPCRQPRPLCSAHPGRSGPSHWAAPGRLASESRDLHIHGGGL